MTYINTDSDADSEKYGVFTQFDGGKFNNAPYRHRANLIVDDTEADPDEAYEPPPLKRVGKPSINDLATWRWQKRTLDAESERKLIRRIQERDAWKVMGCRSGADIATVYNRVASRAFHELLAAHHHSIRPIATNYVPRGWWSPRRDHKHINPKRGANSRGLELLRELSRPEGTMMRALNPWSKSAGYKHCMPELYGGRQWSCRRLRLSSLTKRTTQGRKPTNK